MNDHRQNTIDDIIFFINDENNKVGTSKIVLRDEGVDPHILFQSDDHNYEELEAIEVTGESFVVTTVDQDGEERTYSSDDLSMDTLCTIHKILEDENMLNEEVEFLRFQHDCLTVRLDRTIRDVAENNKNAEIEVEVLLRNAYNEDDAQHTITKVHFDTMEVTIETMDEETRKIPIFDLSVLAKVDLLTALAKKHVQYSGY